MVGSDPSAPAIVDVDAGVCGHKTTVTASKGDGYKVRLTIESSCPRVAKIATETDGVDALGEIGLRNDLPPLLETAYRHCIHAALIGGMAQHSDQ